MLTATDVSKAKDIIYAALAAAPDGTPHADTMLAIMRTMQRRGLGKITIPELGDIMTEVLHELRMDGVANDGHV